MLSRLSDKLSKLVCGFSPPSTAPPLDDIDGESKTCRSGLSSPLLGSLGRAVPHRSWSHPCIIPSKSTAATAEKPASMKEDEETALPCVAFPSQCGYMVFSLAENRMLEDGDVRLRMVSGRRHVPSPYGGKVFATDMFGCHACHLVDPLTGERTPLPHLPIPFSETEPMPCEPDEPRARSRVYSTDDGFAWDWSPHGVMVAHGDTVFFCAAGGDGGGEWRPVHRSRHDSPMTVNYRGGFFFVLELRLLLTTVIDAETLGHSAVIDPPPRRGDIDGAYLVASTDDLLLLVHRAGDEDCEIFSQAYRARHKRPNPSWSRVTDIGDRAVFVDNDHGFTVGAGERARRNHVYMALYNEAEEDRCCGRGVITHSVAVADLRHPKHLAAEGSELSRCKVQRRWGPAHWIICNDGPSSGSSIALEQ